MSQQCKIKICGIQNVQTALFCAKLGVDFIGINFSPFSKRKVELSVAGTICTSLQNTNLATKPRLVFLFYKNSPEFIRSVLQEYKPDFVQFVTEDSLDTLYALQEFPFPLIPQFPIKPNFQQKDLYRYNTEFMILDAYSKGEGGGTGKSFDWELLQGIERKYFLAGGLNPKNIAQAIQTVSPYGVDVASGVESEPGKKDLGLIEEFVTNAQKK
ncbi:MAG: phosphoribosylanthranilate isomerase [Spirochaetota bacterium]